MRFDPVSLALFVRVVEEGSIAAAARAEHIAAAAVSARLSDLERALGTALLRRGRQGVEPTAAGLAFAGMARGVLRAMDDAHLEMKAHATGARGQVRVFANISAITQFLPGELRAFLARHPGVQVRLEEHISADVARAVAENRADVGVFTVGPHLPPLETFPYHRDRLVALVPRRHPLARRRAVRFGDLLDFPFVGLHTGSAINLQLARAAGELGRALHLRVQVTSYDALCHMVGHALGVGVLPERAAEPFLGALGLRALALDEPWAARELRVCVRSFAALPAAARLFVQHLAPQGR